MENQDSTPQEKKKFFNLKGKKKKVIIVVIAAWFLIGIIIHALGFRGAWGNRGYPFMGSGNVVVAAKNFDSMGIVFAEGNGYRTTYNALMKAAAQKGADAIINVNISSTGIFNRTWSGSATAISYLDQVSGDALLIPRNGWFWGKNRF